MELHSKKTPKMPTDDEKTAELYCESDEKAIGETDLKHKKRAKSAWLRFGAMAACLCLLVGTLIAVLLMQRSALPDIPVFSNAQYSAQEIGKLFTRSGYYNAIATNAYTKVSVPDSKYLYIDALPEDEYLDLYQHGNLGTALSEEELQRFAASLLPNLSEALGADASALEITRRFLDADNSLLGECEIGPYNMSVWQSKQYYSVSLYKPQGDRRIVLEGETVRVDQRLCDEEIATCVQSVKNKLFAIFGVSFPDVKIVRSFNGYSTNGVTGLEIYFYDKSAHPLNTLRDIPMSDYICIDFDNYANYTGDIVSDSFLEACYIDYYKTRVDFADERAIVASVKKISLKDAEALLYNGYVFGGHACRLCMKMQEKISFESYDFVDIEYVFERDYRSGSTMSAVPFYAFYKKIGTAENGNTVYAKTYVAAIELSGYEAYFEAQEAYH